MVDATTEAKSASDTATIQDRRRPGRANYQNLHLISLLRGRSMTDAKTADAEAAPTLPPVDTQDDEDNLDASRGILNAAAISAAMWAAIIFGLYHFFL